MQLRIYILEDDRNIGFILDHILTDEGYQVSVYETISAFREALVNMPDLLLMDVRLPDGNGMNLCEELKGPQGISIPVLMMSADWHRHGIEDCLADAHIAKPFEIDDIVKLIARHLKR